MGWKWHLLSIAITLAVATSCGSDKGGDDDDDDDTGGSGVQDRDGDGFVGDDDCDDDDPEVTGPSTWYADADGDGYGDPDSTQEACEQPDGAVADATDCDDTDPDTNPNGQEVCGGGDEDCDGATDDDDPDVTGLLTWYADSDGDGYGDPEGESAEACDAPSGMGEGGDCDDGDADIHPDVPDPCIDEVDDDCDGEIGEDCDSPRDLFDIEAIQALTLDQLGWTLTSTTETKYGTIYTGLWSGGVFPAVHRDGTYMDIDIQSQATFYLPTGWPETEDADKALVYAVHSDTNTESLYALAIAWYFGIPVLYHGEVYANWTDLGYLTREGLHEASGPNLVATNLCEPADYARGNYRWSMAQTDMRAITLAQRLAEQEGGSVETVALRGFSKEGAAAWLAMMVDPRVEIGSPGGFPLEDVVDSAEVMIARADCTGEDDASLMAANAAAGLDWYTNSDGGATYAELFTVDQDLLYPRVLLVDGDVHLPDMHDGQHFAFGCETGFLEELDVPWRYFRKATVTTGSTEEEGDDISTTILPVLAAELLVTGDDPEGTYYPKVEEAEAEIDSDLLEVTATLSAETETAWLWWSWSEDRIWNEEGQTEWTTVELAESGGEWTGSVDLAAEGVEGMAIAWYVEARNSVTIGDSDYSREDSSPVQFLQQPDPWECDADPIDWCE